MEVENHLFVEETSLTRAHVKLPGEIAVYCPDAKTTETTTDRSAKSTTGRPGRTQDTALAFPNQPRAAVGEVVTKAHDTSHHASLVRISTKSLKYPEVLPDRQTWSCVAVNWFRMMSGTELGFCAFCLYCPSMSSSKSVGTLFDKSPRHRNVLVLSMYWCQLYQTPCSASYLSPSS